MDFIPNIPNEVLQSVLCVSRPRANIENFWDQVNEKMKGWTDKVKPESTLVVRLLKLLDIGDKMVVCWEKL